MAHALCFLVSFAVAVKGAVHTVLHQPDLSSRQVVGNTIAVAGLLFLCLLITLDYVTEQIQNRRNEKH